MKKTLGVAALFTHLIFAPSVQPPFERISGTVVVMQIFKQEAIIAADSRGTDLKGKYSDNDCKISSYGDQIIFASSGNRMLSVVIRGKRMLWDSHTFAARAISRANSAKNGNVGVIDRSVANWLVSGKAWFTELQKNDPTGRLKDLSDSANGIAEGFFLGRNESGEIEARHALISLDLAENSNPTIRTTSEILDQGIIVMGITDIASEFVKANTSRSIADVNKWNASMVGKKPDQKRELSTIQLVKWTIQYADSKDVGGDVDSIKLDKSGIHWLTRKNNCKESE